MENLLSCCTVLLTDGLFLFLNACLQYASLEADFSENPVIGDRRQEVWKEVFPFSLVVFMQTLLLCHFCVVLSLSFSLSFLSFSLSLLSAQNHADTTTIFIFLNGMKYTKSIYRVTPEVQR